jgi:hypothetical protein
MNLVVEDTRYQMMRWSSGSITIWFGTDRRTIPIVVVVTPLLLFLSFFDDFPAGMLFG